MSYDYIRVKEETRQRWDADMRRAQVKLNKKLTHDEFVKFVLDQIEQSGVIA